MFPLKNTSQTSLRWLYIYLYVLDIIKKSKFKNAYDLNKIEIDDLIKVTRNLKCKRKALQIIDKVRNGNNIVKSDLGFINLLQFESSLNESPKLSVIKESDHFNGIIDDEYLNGMVSDSKEVVHAIESGFSIIKKLNRKWSNNIVDAIETVCGIVDERDVINSGFIKDVPGLINFNINCKTEVIGEQIVHESTHLIFDNFIFFNKKSRDFIKSIPPVYSVFVKKPRSAELVLHGLFSYSSVYIYWDHLEKNKLVNRSDSKFRKRQVKKYIEESVKDLNNVLSVSEWNKLKQIYSKICPLFSDDIWQINLDKNIVKNEILKSCRKIFNDIEIAELLLAIEGNKVSRLSINIKQAGDVVKILHKLPVYYCFSNFVFESAQEENLNDFKNVITSIHQLDSYYDQDLEIHVYLSNNKLKLKSAFILDQKDECGSLFQIPKCCQKYFKYNWSNAVKFYNGDLARMHYGKGAFSDNENLLYKPFGMYFGGGLCWHFPCEKNCVSTRKLIDKRIEVLSNYPSSLKKILSHIPKKISYSKQNGYKASFQ